jgi:hypothetical protein
MESVGRAVAACVVFAGCAEPGGRTHQTWSPTIGTASEDDDGGDDETGLDVDPIDETSVGPFVDEEEGGNEGFECNGDDAQECDCLAEPGTGVQFCEDGVWGECMCNGSESDGGESTSASADDDGAPADDDGTTGAPAPTEVCFPGADESYSTCFDLVYIDPDAAPEGYEYPDALGGDANYRRPIAFIDLEAIDGSTSVAPNFALDELAQAFKGRWAIVQPHAVESLQALRDAAGAINVTSGYRSPAYNAEIGGAGYSRHMYGDGFDLAPVGVTIDELETLCEGEGGMLVEYETHVHCDWRAHDVAVEFFGPEDAAAPLPPAFAARIERDGASLRTSDEGFDEGEPARLWIAIDERGRTLAQSTGRAFVPPPDAFEVRVTVGRVASASLRP